MTDDLPAAWSRDRADASRPTPNATPRRFLRYVHDTGDVSLRVAPATLETTGRPGYELSVTIYPGLELEERTVLRTVTTCESCERLARQFMSVFDGRYEGPANTEAAVEYAAERVAPSAAHDGVVTDR